MTHAIRHFTHHIFNVTGLRLFGTMFAAAVLRRHLMVWKIFAPRFIFEGVGFAISMLCVFIGYMIVVRIHSVLTKYFQVLEKEK